MSILQISFPGQDASSVPKLINGKWPASLGQLAGGGLLKKVAGAFPITTCINRIIFQKYTKLK